MRILMFLFLIGFIVPTWAKSIDKIVLKGNKKTKKSAILRKVGIEIGKKLTDTELNLIIEQTKRINQFNIKEIKFQDNTLFIDIEDKWTFFPVPIISQSDKYNSLGIVLFDNNFLGRLATVGVGISRTNSRWNGLVYWQEDGIIAKNIGMKVITMLRSDLIEFQRGGEVKSTLESKFNMLILTPNYRHGRNNHALGPIYIKKNIINRDDDTDDFSDERFGLFYRHLYKKFKKLPVLFDGFETTYDIFVIPKGNSYDHLQSGLFRFIKPWGKHFFTSRFHFSYTNNTGHLSPKMLGGDDGHSGYGKKTLSAQRNVGFALKPEFYLWNRWFVAPFYEFNHLKLIKPVLNGAELNESVVGVKMSYYFKKISIPAVSMGYTRNIDDKSDYFQFNVGLAL